MRLPFIEFVYVLASVLPHSIWIDLKSAVLKAHTSLKYGCTLVVDVGVITIPTMEQDFHRNYVLVSVTVYTIS